MACRAVLQLEHSSSAKTLRGRKWRPITTFPFEEVVKAHQAMETGNSVGKLVLVV